MGIVVDTCTLACVFDKDNANHAHFKPVHDWLYHGQGKLVYGGRTYLRELRLAPRYLALFLELGRLGKMRKIDDASVDRTEKLVRQKFKRARFNDAHLIAIVSVSGCRIVCTNDHNAMPFLKNGVLYPKGIKRPKIYCREDHGRLLKVYKV